MNDWTDGYITETDYTYGFYHQFSPGRVQLALVNRGLVAPVIQNACELGFGQGISVNIFAAATQAKWFGTDFNPAHAAFAQSLAQAAQTQAGLYDASFAEFAQRSDLPDFEFIGLHGIWSWISAENRTVLVDFIRRKLKVGGVLYISYNTLPGWASFAPIRHLMVAHAAAVGSRADGAVARAQAAIRYAESVLALKPAFARQHPHVASSLEKVKKQNQTYVPHEYFNADWEPMHFSTMQQCLAPAKLSYACPAGYFEHIDTLNLSAEQRQFINATQDPVLRETVRDLMVNKRFRADYWVKGARRITMAEQAQATRNIRVMLVVPQDAVKFKVAAPIGEVSVDTTVCEPIMAQLADLRPRSLGELQAAMDHKILIGAGYLEVVQSDAAQTACALAARRLNDALMTKAQSTPHLGNLASPVTGSGVAVSRFHQMFLQARLQQPEVSMAAFAWQALQAQNERVMKNGQPLASAPDNLAELQTKASAFEAQQLPILKALRVI